MWPFPEWGSQPDLLRLLQSRLGRSARLVFRVLITRVTSTRSLLMPGAGPEPYGRSPWEERPGPRTGLTPALTLSSSCGRDPAMSNSSDSSFGQRWTLVASSAERASSIL